MNNSEENRYVDSLDSVNHQLRNCGDQLTKNQSFPCLFKENE